jgi:hypothetical protein
MGWCLVKHRENFKFTEKRSYSAHIYLLHFPNLALFDSWLFPNMLRFTSRNWGQQITSGDYTGKKSS